LGVDAAINRGMLETLIDRLPDDLDIRILPIQQVGKSNEHLRMPGTLTLPGDDADRGLDRARIVGSRAPACGSS
jgi:creatinine amidohydrolase/Fe(II)-dependent formamide hydrolase-like protein